MLPLQSYLDPRPAEEAMRSPYLDCVNIPLAYLHSRAYELPSKREEVVVVGESDLVERAVNDLIKMGRRARTGPAPTRGADWGAGRLWKPNPFLEESVQLWPIGKSLDLACGTGRDSIYLASLGWQVTGIDHLPDAISRADALADRYEFGSIRPKFCQGDVRNWDESDTHFDLVTSFFYFDPNLPERALTLLHPGGLLMIEAFTETHRARFGKPGESRLVTAELPQQLEDLGFQVLNFSSAWRGDIHTARLIARNSKSAIRR